MDLDHNGYELTSVAEGVWFDLNGDGKLEKISWTKSGSDEGFLWVDHDENGYVTNGRELFGAFQKENGFQWLAQRDEPAREDVDWGGDGNGVLDATDAIWARLLFWVDGNHDGISQDTEIFAVTESPLLAIDLSYRWSGHRDQHGNAFRYGSTTRLKDEQGAAVTGRIYDIFLAVQR